MIYPHYIPMISPLKSPKGQKKNTAAAKVPSVFEAAAPSAVHVLVSATKRWGRSPEEHPIGSQP